MQFRTLDGAHYGFSVSYKDSEKDKEKARGFIARFFDELADQGLDSVFV
jgi:hypothetical protein